MLVAVAVVAVLAVATAVALAWHARNLAGHTHRAMAQAEASERRRAEAECHTARLSAALGAMEHGVVIFGDNGVSVYHNAPAAIYLDARHGDALVEEAISDMADLPSGTVRHRDLEVFGPPRRTLILRAVSLSSAAEEPSVNSTSGVLVVIEDVTERRRLENVRRDFVANISHELKTPVGALALLAETLGAENDPEVLRKLSSGIETEAFRVANTLEDLLELSRLEGDREAPGEPLAVSTFMVDAADRVQPAADRREIPLRVTEPPDGLTIRGDRPQLVSAVANLLDNAVKYSEPGSPVELSVQTVGNWVEVQVRDRGIGIPRHELERIFERFYRVDRARSRETGGTGLGLAIVRHVAANHHGEVRVSSREGEGSCFTLRLPSGVGEEPSNNSQERSKET